MYGSLLILITLKVSADVAQRWNAGKLKVLQAVDAYLGNEGPWFANGDRFENDNVFAWSNFHGAWGGNGALHSGDPRALVQWVNSRACLGGNHTYVGAPRGLLSRSATFLICNADVHLLLMVLSRRSKGTAT